MTLLRPPKERVDWAPLVAGPPDVLALLVAGIDFRCFEFRMPLVKCGRFVHSGVEFCSWVQSGIVDDAGGSLAVYRPGNESHLR